MSLSPVAFLVVGQGQVRLLPVDGTAIYDRLIDLAPQVMDRIQTMVRNGKTEMPRTYQGVRGNILET